MKNFPRFNGDIPSITIEQMMEVDRLMVEDYHITLLQMMENAGRNLARLATQRFLHQHTLGKRIVVLAGSGGNGGGALVAARRLHNWGAKVKVFLTRPAEAMEEVPRHQLCILERMGVDIKPAKALTKSSQIDLIIDGIIGYSIKGNPRGRAKTMIEWANAQSAPILSLDTPSGLDLTTGTLHDPVIKATATLTLALPKKGLFNSAAIDHRGELYLGDLSVPPKLYCEGLKIGICSSIFAKSDILRLEDP